MKYRHQPGDLPRQLFMLLFFLMMIIACFWVIQPFILGFTWAGMMVIATWNFMLRLQKWLFGKRTLAVLAMTLILLLVFIIPVAVLINSVFESLRPAIALLNTGQLQIPSLLWLDQVPVVGPKLMLYYQKIIAGGGKSVLTNLQPYIGQTTSFFVSQAGHVGRLMVHITLMLLFSILLYWKGERVAEGIRHFAYRLASGRGDAVVLLAGQAIRAVALGVVVTALLQGVIGGIGLALAGIPYATILTVLLILCCLIQVGPLLVLIPAIIWLYWSGDTTWGTVLLIWSLVVATMDSVVRPMLIRLGADLPMLIILSGVIGGLIAFGLIGLFIGPVVLAVSYRLIKVWINQVPVPQAHPDRVIEALFEDTRKSAEQVRNSQNNQSI